MTLLLTALAPTGVSAATPRESIRELCVTVQLVIHAQAIIFVAGIQTRGAEPVLVEINVELT